MAEVLDWRRVDDVPAFARFAARALRRGYLIAFPTGSGYVAAACALCGEAMARLLDVGDRPLEVACHAEAVRDWLPGLNAPGRRLARRFWPGPLVLAGDGARGLASRLAPDIRECLAQDGALYARHPDHEALREAAGMLAAPLAMRAVAAPDGEAFHARQVLDAAGRLCNLLIDDGPSRHRQPATVVEIQGDGWRVRRPGVIGEDLIRQQLATLILFVCTGNTCRSPLAEALCKKALAERLKCGVEELPTRGYRVLSAGMAAVSGMPAADEAVAVAQALGADLRGHASRPLSAELLATADEVFVMTEGHLRALTEAAGGQVEARLLSPDGDDVDDPIGQAREVYEACARQMLAHIEARLAEVV